MGEGGPGGKFGFQGGQRALRVGADAVLLLPVGQEEAQLPFAAGVTAPEQVPGPAPGVEQIGHRRLLSRGEERGVGGDAPALGQLQLVQHPGQQHPLLAIPGAAVQQLFFVHGNAPLHPDIRFSISAAGRVVKGIGA